MRLKEVHVLNYKTVLDTGCEVRPDVTCLLGKNESGKSAILQAIWKSKNVAGVKHDYLYDYPKEIFTRDRGTDPLVSELRFFLEPNDAEAFKAEVGLTAPEEVLVSTTYQGKQSCAFDLGLRIFAADELRRMLDALDSELQDDEGVPAEPTRQAARSAVAELRTASDEPLDGPKLRAAAASLRKAITPIQAQLKGDVGRFDVLDVASSYKTPEEDTKAGEAFLLQRLPTFIYFEDYGRLETRIHLPTFIQQKTQSPIEPRVRTQIALFEWAKLSAEELQQLGRQPDPGESQESIERRKEERATLLESASYALSGEWVDWWDQREHKLHIEADGDDLVLKVADNENPWKVAFRERSKGFQWFFSFYLTFIVESEKSHHGAILLLDEPGLHLHIRAQQKLLAFFQKISNKNQLLYTSHSPFLVDPENLDNVRTVFLKKDQVGVRFHTNMATGTAPGGDRDTVLPLQAALGYELAQTLFLGKRTLVVEGFSDYMLLKYLSHELGASGRECLPEDVVVIFAGGTSHILPLVSLFSRPDQGDRRLVVLLDADKAGQEKAKQLRKDLLCRDGAVVLLSEADFLGFADAEVEDVVDRQELVAAVRALRGQHITLPAPEPATNVAFLKALYGANGWDSLTHVEKAGVVLSVIEGWRQGSKLSVATIANAEKIFQGLKKRFQ